MDSDRGATLQPTSRHSQSEAGTVFGSVPLARVRILCTVYVVSFVTPMCASRIKQGVHRHGSMGGTCWTGSRQQREAHGPCFPQGVGSNRSQSNCNPLLDPWRILTPSSTPSLLARSTEVAAVINESPTMWAALMAEVTRSSML